MNKFIINEEEKRRILMMHQSATKNQYLNETIKNVATTTAKVGGPNYDKAGTVYFPAGGYNIGAPDSFSPSFTIENTGDEILYIYGVLDNPGLLTLGIDISYDWFIAELPNGNSVSFGSEVGYNHPILIMPGEKINVKPSYRLLRKFDYKEGYPLIVYRFQANVLKRTTPFSMKDGEIQVEMGWNDEVSYFIY